ncbi:NAD(P)H nitroreductase [Alteromonas sp. KUL49]|uniref:NAD(P)H nitroreductase n=1 Tax=Alteromonas sp. KUL49 TaxID=2480798 RepID=UPI00102EEA31|nr:NAD(P)H nitroreductase [Alteromonas sp. KUL49]TAP36898.1 NAD(P)H nitroreductase [Alteromonas sp. KUL49]GEA13164.1 NAD(P)H nitroreductase [Alteromonas sp. KUL49]
MDALELLLTRRSQPKLVAPAPSGKALENILKAGTQVPDHAGLCPWRFIVCTGDGLNRLGEIYSDSARSNDKPDSDINRAKQLPLRAPMVVVAIARYVEHEKVPRVEQIGSAACSVMAMQMAALAQGFNGMWRTGSYAHCEHVKTAFELEKEDEIVGYLYLGTPQFAAPTKPEKNLSDFVTYWN